MYLVQSYQVVLGPADAQCLHVAYFDTAVLYNATVLLQYCIVLCGVYPVTAPLYILYGGTRTLAL
jgi:hypothetical protein